MLVFHWPPNVEEDVDIAELETLDDLWELLNNSPTPKHPDAPRSGYIREISITTDESDSRALIVAYVEVEEGE